MSNLENKNFVKFEPHKTTLEFVIDNVLDEINQLNKTNQINDIQNISEDDYEQYELDENIENRDEEYNNIEIDDNAETLVFNLDIKSLINKYLNLNDYNSQIENIVATQNELLEKINSLTKQVESPQQVLRFTYRGGTKIYY